MTAELDFARCAVGTRNLTEAGVLRRAAGGIWVGVVGSVGKVEGIHLKARHHPLTNLYRLRQRGVRVPVRADQLVLIAIALNQGLAMHHLMDPKHYPDHLVTASSELVFDRLMGFTGK